MRLLLDTNIFLWCALNDARLTDDARTLLTHADAIYVSSACIWEISIKKSLGKIDAANGLGKLTDAIEASGFLELPITSQHAAAVCSLAPIHRDPFDRIMLAQAITEPLVFVTSDQLLQGYSNLVKVI